MTQRIGGWLLLLCALLVIWQPLSVAVSLLSLWPSIAMRGLPALLIAAVRFLVAAFGAAAGMALFRRQPGAVALVIVSLAATAVTDLFLILTPYFPGNQVPGDEPVHAAWTTAWFAGWLMYLLRSARVRRTFSG